MRSNLEHSTSSLVSQAPLLNFKQEGINLVVAFCLFLGIWVFFFVPETKGVRIEEMDKLFGGNQGEQDLLRIADIRAQLGIVDHHSVAEKAVHTVATDQVESISGLHAFSAND